MEKRIVCSFCGKDKDQVKNLISGGPNFNEGDKGHTIYICNECVNLCVEIIGQEED